MSAIEVIEEKTDPYNRIVTICCSSGAEGTVGLNQDVVLFAPLESVHGGS